MRNDILQHAQAIRDSEDGKLYLCQHTGEAYGGTVVLQYMPHELVGNYFVET